MSFSVWRQQPPFAEASLTSGEHIYQVGAYWIVTDQGTPTQAQIDQVLTPQPDNLTPLLEARRARKLDELQGDVDAITDAHTKQTLQSMLEFMKGDSDG